jgi:hypothetical protein
MGLHSGMELEVESEAWDKRPRRGLRPSRFSNFKLRFERILYSMLDAPFSFYGLSVICIDDRDAHCCIVIIILFDKNGKKRSFYRIIVQVCVQPRTSQSCQE